MIRLPVALASAAFALDALDDSPALSIVAGLVIAAVCLWCLQPSKGHR